MTQVKAGNTVLRQYQYNAKGEQTRSYRGTENAYFVYDEAGHLLGEYDSNGSPTQQILWFGDLPVGVLQGSGASQQLHYIEPDHLGTPRVIIDGQRNVAIWEWKLTGEAFGASPPNQDPDGDGVNFAFDLRFPGQRYDSATGLNYNYFRDYDPATGRYMESDPIGLKGGVSTYGYGMQDPLRQVDPWGLQSIFPGPEACRYYEKQCKSSCGKDEDTYACKAKKCCESFGDNFSTNCTRKCLINWDESHCARLSGEARNICRRRAHFFCYFNCGNVRDAVMGGFGTLPPPQCLGARDALGGFFGIF